VNEAFRRENGYLTRTLVWLTKPPECAGKVRGCCLGSAEWRVLQIIGGGPLGPRSGRCYSLRSWSRSIATPPGQGSTGPESAAPAVTVRRRGGQPRRRRYYYSVIIQYELVLYRKYFWNSVPRVPAAVYAYCLPVSEIQPYRSRRVCARAGAARR
jgi:hypothetical protein